MGTCNDKMTFAGVIVQLVPHQSTVWCSHQKHEFAVFFLTNMYYLFIGLCGIEITPIKFLSYVQNTETS